MYGLTMEEAKWIWESGDNWRCSNCGVSPAGQDFVGNWIAVEDNLYCYNCGCKMTIDYGENEE